MLKIPSQCLTTTLLVSAAFISGGRHCIAQQRSPSVQEATVAIFGDYQKKNWQSISTGIMIGHIGDQLHYVLTVISPCRQRPARLWILHNGETRDVRPSKVREAFTISKNPDTGLTLLFFHESIDDGKFSYYQP